MHYGGYGFASDPYTPTISTLDKNLQGTIGQRTGPSFLDFAAINIAYRCFEHCGYIPCQHHGYPNPNNCSECLCPEGFSGSLCQYVQYTSCGAHIEVSRDAVSISSPNYPYQFNRNSDCVWFLKAPVGGKVFFEFEDTFQFQCEDTCDKSFVEVKPGPDFRITGYRFCCSVRPKQRFEAFGGKMLVFLRGFGERSRGFKARVWSDVSPVTPVSTSTSTTTTTTTYTTTTTAIPTTTVSVPPSSTEQTENETSSVVQPEEIPIWTTENPSESTFEMVLETITDTPTESIKSTPKAVKPAPVAVITEWPRPVPVVSPITPLTVAPVDECGCKRWSEWQGSCSQDCGGCGKRRRTRVCLKENCRSEEKRACNFGICPPGTNFLINNGEFHILWKGCCVGLFRSGRSCSTLEDGDNPFLKIISSLLSPSDSRRNATALTSVPHV
ncbi:hypothetical protein L596_003643 [Steinernema carpocapsae]|uniref:CUB domain-containing protein n=1 Tax=Steinernema carpocapsae TaxID=34508 RepID=A0A4V6I834_STECR|nr:hypothetical protein L596_003643 [Steinernema carpocapsae]